VDVPRWGRELAEVSSWLKELAVAEVRSWGRELAEVSSWGRELAELLYRSRETFSACINEPIHQPNFPSLLFLPRA
jgi:hypothetical protein